MRWPSARCMPASSSRAISVFSAMASGSSIWRSRWATSIAASSRPCSAGRRTALHPLCRNAGRRHDHRPRHRLLPGARGAGPLPEDAPAPRRCAASPWNWNGWPITSATSAPWPATSGFLPTASYCGRIRGDFLNMTALLCGNRFGRGMIRPGGVGFDVDEARLAELLRRLDVAEKETAGGRQSALGYAVGHGPFRGRPARCRGRSPSNSALSAPRPAPRGLARDVRSDQPSGIFRFAQIPVSTWDTGDVFARAYVRWLEIQQSIEFIREQLRRDSAGTAAGHARAAVATIACGRAQRRLARRGLPCGHHRRAGPLRPLQGGRSVVPQLVGAGLRPAQSADFRFPAVQQELQPVLLRTRSVSRRPVACHRLEAKPCSRYSWPDCSKAIAR